MARIVHPKDPGEASRLAAAAGAELCAGGTDVVDRLKSGALAPDTLVSLRRIEGRASLREEAGALVLGAGTTLLELAEHPRVRAELGVLAEAARHTATPQIRAQATLGGALCQRPRCTYLRHPDYLCRKEGGAHCYALEGDNACHAIFDNELCAAVHPSTVGAALLALDAELEVHIEGARRTLRVADFFAIAPTDPRQLARENTLPQGALIEAVRVPLFGPSSRQRYERASPRALADWAEVEVAVRIELDQGRVADARIVLGAVGRVPRRARASEAALLGGPLTPERITAASALAPEGARPLAHNRHKVELCRGTVRAALSELLT